MSTKITHQVEFLGGPYDGHIASLPVSPSLFICVPVRRRSGLGSWLQRCFRLLGQQSKVVTAIYELHDEDGILRYLHVRSQTAAPNVPRFHVDA